MLNFSLVASCDETLVDCLSCPSLGLIAKRFSEKEIGGEPAFSADSHLTNELPAVHRAFRSPKESKAGLKVNTRYDRRESTWPRVAGTGLTVKGSPPK